MVCPALGGSETGAWTGEDLRGETACLRMEKVTITAPCPIQAGPQPCDSLAEAYAQFMLDAGPGTSGLLPSASMSSSLPFLAWCSDTGAEGIEGVLPAHVRSYIAQRREQGLVDASLRVGLPRPARLLLVLRRMKSLIDRSPMDKVTKLRREQRIPQALDCAGVTRLLQACDHVRDQALVLVLVDTGCRASELLGKRFHGAKELDPMLLSSEAAKVAENVHQFLSSLPNASLCVTLEIEADLPDGVPEHNLRTILENARTLGFSSFEFEDVD